MPWKPKDIVPESLRAVYTEVVTKVTEPQQQSQSHVEVYDEINRLAYHTRTGNWGGTRTRSSSCCGHSRRRMKWRSQDSSSQRTSSGGHP